MLAVLLLSVPLPASPCNSPSLLTARTASCVQGHTSLTPLNPMPPPLIPSRPLNEARGSSQSPLPIFQHTWIESAKYIILWSPFENYFFCCVTYEEYHKHKLSHPPKKGSPCFLLQLEKKRQKYLHSDVLWPAACIRRKDTGAAAKFRRGGEAAVREGLRRPLRGIQKALLVVVLLDTPSRCGTWSNGPHPRCGYLTVPGAEGVCCWLPLTPCGSGLAAPKLELPPPPHPLDCFLELVACFVFFNCRTSTSCFGFLSVAWGM